MKNNNSNVNMLYRKSILIDSFFGLVLFPPLVLTSGYFYNIVLGNDYMYLRTLMIIMTVLAFFLIYSFFGTLLFRNQSIGMRISKIKITNNCSSRLNKLRALVFRTFIISSYIPFWGPDFNTLCKRADRFTFTKIELI